MTVNTQNDTHEVSSAMLFNKTAESIPLQGHKKGKSKSQKIDIESINYKNIPLLTSYITKSKGRILPGRLTNLSRKEQRRLAKAIKIARILALLPFASPVL
jgi:small subunit ribosomal protein S18